MVDMENMSAIDCICYTDFWGLHDENSEWLGSY